MVIGTTIAIIVGVIVGLILLCLSFKVETGGRVMINLNKNLLSKSHCHFDFVIIMLIIP